MIKYTIITMMIGTLFGDAATGWSADSMNMTSTTKKDSVCTELKVKNCHDPKINCTEDEWEQFISNLPLKSKLRLFYFRGSNKELFKKLGFDYNNKVTTHKKK